MPVFTYRGRSQAGDLVQGTLEGVTSSAVADQLVSSGIIPIDIKPSKKIRASESAEVLNSQLTWWEKLNQKPVTPLDLMMFSRQMHTLMKAGVPIMRALAGLQESAQNPSFSAVLKDLRESLDSGRELSAALRRHPKLFEPFYVSMVQVGEMTGMLDETFMRLYDHLAFEKQMRDNIKSAVRYPSFVVIAMAIAILIVNIFVIPAFVKVFDNFHTTLPLMTRLLIGSSNFFVHYWWVVLAIIAGVSYAFNAYINTVKGRFKWDEYKFKLPIAGKIVLKSTLARFARSLALGMKSGIPIVQGLNAVALVVDNEFMRDKVERMRDGVERGESILRTSSAAGVFNPVVLQMIAVGEETGDLDGLMFEIAGMYEQEVEYEVKTISAQIEPIMIISLGIMVLILALGIFLPMWDLGNAAMHKN